MRTLQKVSARTLFLLAVITAGVFYLIGIAAAFAPGLYTGLLWLSFLIIFAVLCFAIGRRSCEISNELLILISFIAFILLLVLQFFCVQVFVQEPSGDYGDVFLAAKEYAGQGRILTNVHYFDRSPEDCGLFVILALFFLVLNFLGIPITASAAALLNMVFIDAALLFMLLFVRKIWRNKKALIFTVMSLFFTPYILYVPLLYTDTVSMLFVTSSLYLFACLLKQRSRGFRVLQMVSVALLLGFGTAIKSGVLAVLVALLIYLALRLRIQRFLAVLLAFVIPFAGFLLGFDTLMKKEGIITPAQNEYRLPPEFRIYTGLQKDEDLLRKEREQISAVPGYDAKRQAAREGIQELLSEYGVMGFFAQVIQKAGKTYGDGTYGAGERLAAGPVMRTEYLDIFTADGSRYRHYRSAANAYHAAILIFLAIGLVRGCGKRRFDLETLLYLMLFGQTLYVMVWEADPRALLGCSPIMLALAARSLLDTGKDAQKIRYFAADILRRKRGRHTGAEKRRLKHALPEFSTPETFLVKYSQPSTAPVRPGGSSGADEAASVQEPELQEAETHNMFAVLETETDKAGSFGQSGADFEKNDENT